MLLPLIAMLVTIISLAVLVSGTANIIPSDSSKLNEWIARNMRQHREGLDDPKLPPGAKRNEQDERLTAEEHVKIVRVRKDGRGDFKTIKDAIDSIPCGNTNRVVICIAGGEYREKITIDRCKPFVTLYGENGNMPIISFDGTAYKYGTVYSATVAVESDYFVAVNIAFVNSAPMPDGKRVGAQAVAMRISGDKSAFHNCKFIGFQDTLCDDKGRHFFRDCYIEGTVDFIFGNGKSLYLNTTIKSVANGMGVITAQARVKVDDDSGFAFAFCKIIGSRDTYLGRAWKERSRVVFAYTYMGSLINTQGWLNNNNAGTAYFGEYKCSGPGASSNKRTHYARKMSDEEANAFLSMTFINGNKWLLPVPKL